MSSPKKNKPSVSSTQSKKDQNSGKQVKRNKPVNEQKSFIQTLDNYIGAHMSFVFSSSVFLTILFGILLFDVKISTGGDDSSYIEMANNFIKGRSFPSWHGPFYSIFLSIPMMIFGVKVVWLKIISFVFILAHIIIFYYTFKDHVSPSIFSLILLIISINSSILYFASQTYSEAMFMFLQSLIIIVFLKLYNDSKNEVPVKLKQLIINWLILGFFVFLASLTRNIGIVILAAIIVFLVYERKYLESAIIGLSYLVFLVPYKIYKSIFWATSSTANQGQLSELLLKNPYNRALGSEDFMGMVTRFLDNAKSYLSKHFMIGISLHDPTSIEKSWFVTLIIVVLFVIAVIYAFKRSKVMLFLSIYLGGLITATFIALQQSWDQMRMIIIYIPMLLLLLAWGIQQSGTRKGYGFLNVVLPLLLILILFKTFDVSIGKIKANNKVLSKNMKGNMYYGFTPDWQNYLLMSEWVGKNIPGNVMVASRKPSMSFIYSKGRDFYGIYRFPTSEPVNFIKALENRTGQLRVIPNKEIRKELPVNIQIAIKQNAVAYVAEGNEVYGVYNFNQPGDDELVQMLPDYSISPFPSDSLLNNIKKSTQNCFAVSPDSLLNTLKRNNVHYVIDASLRANPNMNTGNIINNIQRYLYFIEQKYPGLFSIAHQVGEIDKEPAWLYKINYDFYGL